MDKDFKLNLNHKQAIRLVKVVVMALLIITEIIICVQYVSVYVTNGSLLRLIAVLGSCLALGVLETIDSLVIKRFAVKMVFYGVDSVLLLILCILTGNTYLSTLYCIVLTQFYVSVEDFKSNIILFGVSCGLFVISFITGWVIVNEFISLYHSIVQIFGDCLFGVFILALHFVVTNFILKFYSKHAQLRLALKEADESKAQLKEVYEQLSQTAVFEERNRIAKDIHDNAGHSITTVIMQTEAAKLLVDTNPEEAKNRIVSANIQAKNALEQMRESVHLLAGRDKPRTLKEEIEEIIAQTMDGTELKMRYDLEDIAVDNGKFRFICNSIKECIANGIRHGKATAFYVEMKKSLSGMTVLISDNGCGFDGPVTEGFGLRGIREKAEKLGGKCSISSEEGEGFEVEITLPLDKV